MKKIVSILLCMAMILVLAPYMAASEGGTGAFVDQESVVGSYRDGTGDLKQMDRGFSSNMFLYPSPEKMAIGNPISYTFLNMCLMHYSAYNKNSINYGKADVPLDDNFFESLRRTLDNARNNGVMLGIRFQYDTNGNELAEPDWNNLLYHFEQIRDSGILDEYADIIEWCELGTIGAFGEQWGSRYGDTRYSTELIDIYLSMFREDIPILLRTNGRNLKWLNDKLGTNYTEQTMGSLLSEVAANYGDVVNNTSNYYSGDGKNYSTGRLVKDDLSRLGLYNDGYMGTLIDYGTYRNRAQETKFLFDQKKDVYGGEFSGDRFMQVKDGNNINTVWHPVNAIPEMYYTSLTYLHGGPWRETSVNHTFNTENDANTFITYLENTYDMIGATHLKGTATTETTAEGKYKVSYIAPGYDTLPFTAQIEQNVEEKIGVSLDLSEYYNVNTHKFIMDHMGYRFVLRSSKISGASFLPGDTLGIDLSIENTGFNHIIKNKEVELIFVNGSKSYTISLPDIDITSWETGMNYLSKDITLPENIEGGTWKVYLRISAENEDTADDNKWCVQFANDNIYNAEYGANIVGEITVDAPETPDIDSFVDTRMTGEYYDDTTAYAADADYLPLLKHSYTFTQDDLVGFTLLIKVDGIENSDGILVSRWETNGSGSMLHAFNYFFRRGNILLDENGNQLKHSSGLPIYESYGVPFTENGYYLMYNPFPSVALNTTVNNRSVAGSTKVDYFYCNSTGTAREDKLNPTVLNGNNATITPLGIVEGAVTSYDVTFHYNGDRNYTGNYSFKNTDRPVTENCQFRAGESVLGLYDGETPSSYTDGALTYRFVGWTTQEGYRQGLVSDSLIACGTLDLYPYYEIDIGASALNANTYTLNGSKDSYGVVYTLNEATRTAYVGTGSTWTNNSGFGKGLEASYAIPAYVISGGVYYKVVGVSSNAFADCDKLKAAFIPETVTDIADDAFKGIAGSVKFYSYQASAAISYAAEKGIAYESCTDRSKFAVVYVDENENVIDVKSVNSGGMTASSVTLERAGDETCCRYDFAGFDTDGKAVTSDATAHPVFTSVEHTPGEETVLSEGSCIADRITVVYCTGCNKELERNVTRGEHSFTNYVSNGDATCTNDGTKTAVCDVCGAAESTVDDIGSKLGHKGEHCTITAVAYAGIPGEKSFECINCTQTVTVSYSVDKYGDANGDGEVNVLDAVILRRFLAGLDVGEANIDALNVHGVKIGVSDKPNQVDLTKLVRYIAGWDGYTLDPER